MIGVPKDVEYRNRALLDLAHRHDAFCSHCGRPGPCEPAHANWSEYGKGERHKAHDCFWAAMCHACHGWLDSGSGRDPTDRYDATRADKREAWQAAFTVTVLWLWRNSLVQVAGKR